MFKIPITYADENESYITLPALKRFAKERKRDDLKTTFIRETLIRNIQDYANRSPENLEDVQNWIDCVLKEGIKDIYIKYLQLELIDVERLNNDDVLNEILNKSLINPANQHFCGNTYEKKFKLVRYEIHSGDYGRVITIFMSKLIHNYDRKLAKVMMYPISIDLYVDRNMIIARGKSKSNMYELMESGFDFEKSTSTNVEKELKKAIAWVTNILSISIKQQKETVDTYRSKLYTILDRYTKTPNQIRDLMDSKKDEIKNLASIVIGEICNLTDKYLNDVNFDIENMIEKYFSISYPDKTIFTQDREAYPLKIVATDEEDSKVEQTAAFEEPLQSKAVFFDNKKMMQKSKLCDGVWFRFHRLDSTYCSKQFNVKVLAKNDLILKFTEYTMEEDIVHVLFELIDA